MLAATRHYEHALAPLRSLRIDLEAAAGARKRHPARAALMGE